MRFKSIMFAAAVVLVSQSTARAEHDPIPRPDHLRCVAIQCLIGNPDFCNPETFKVIYLKNLRSEKPRWMFEKGRLTYGPDATSAVVIDFGISVHGGDQHSFFTFSKAGLAALDNGSRKRISAEYEDGYDWANGYNVRARMRLECTTESEPESEFETCSG